MTEPDYSEIFHQSSKNLSKGHLPIARDPKDWPKEWSTVYYKTYERLPQVALPMVPPIADLGETIWNRVSSRNFSGEPLSLDALGTLLKYSCGTTRLSSDGKSMRRAQASGGARYPIEVYPLVLRAGEGYGPGLYHYQVKTHALEMLWDHIFTPEELDKLFVYGWVKNASVILLMTAVFRRNQIKYGERGYRHVLLEAGHIGQNLYLVATALKLKCCTLGGTYDEQIEELLDVDGIQESVVYAVAIG